MRQPKPTPTAALRFIRMIARLVKEGECMNCKRDQDDKPGRGCTDHQGYEMPGDDAAETLNGLISQAREMLEKRNR